MARNLKTFSYVALTKDGKRIKGTYDARNKKVVIEYLYSQGLTPLYVDEVLPILSLKKLQEINIGGFPFKEKYFLIKQFSVMLNAGVPVAKILSILARQSTYPPLKKILQEVYKDVTSGKTLTYAFSKHKDLFDDVTLALIEAGETSGTLDKVFKRLSRDFSKRQKLLSAIKTALTYPVVVGFVIVAVLAFITFVITPQLKQVFEDFDLNLPLVTKILLFVSDTAIKYSYIYLFVGLVIGILIYKYAKSEAGKKVFDRIKLSIPIFGRIYKDYQLALFARVMFLTLSAGVPILKSLRLAYKASPNFWYKLEIKALEEHVASGGKASEYLLRSSLFPPIVGYMFEIGEQSGQLDKVLGKLSQFYENEVMSTVKNLSEILQPVLVLILGIVVGVIVIAIYLPLTQLAKSIG